MIYPALAHLKTFVKENMPIVAAAYRTAALYFLRKKDARRFVNEFIRERTACVVQYGPFRGMRLLSESSWGDGDISPKLLGLYEQELHGILARAARRHYGAIVDVGSAEGYYAVGFARMFPGVRVYAYDTDPAALRLAERTAAANGVEAQVSMSGFCNPPTLMSLAQTDGPLLVMCDCEGYEMTLFGSQEVCSSLRSSDILIECHDFIVPNCMARLMDILAKTHNVTVIRAGGRDPNAVDFLAELSDWDRWMAVCEGRPCRMSWLWCEGRGVS